MQNQNQPISTRDAFRLVYRLERLDANFVFKRHALQRNGLSEFRASVMSADAALVSIALCLSQCRPPLSARLRKYKKGAWV